MKENVREREGFEKEALVRKLSTIVDSEERNLKRSQLKYYSDTRSMDELTARQESRQIGRKVYNM